jgi:anti-sigma-K factor RskA
MAVERKIDGATLADLADTVSRLREKFADLPEDQAIAEAERAVLETRDAMRAERADMEKRNCASTRQ